MKPRTGTKSERTPAPRRGMSAALRIYTLRHLQNLFYTLGQLSRRPFSTLMTTAVIGIALAMPAGLHVLLKNARQVTEGWDGATQISLFLKAAVEAPAAQALAQRLEQEAHIAEVRYISPAQALAEFQELSGFGKVLEYLDDNPLPAVLVVHPTLSESGPAEVQRLLEQLARYPEVEMAQLDMQWVKRLYAIMAVVERGVGVLAVLLALAVLLVVGNTIRLAIQNRRDEIVITKLIGGTDAFIRRPFLYTGFWYGLLGGVIALLLIGSALWLLRSPIHQLAVLYHSPFRFDVLGTDTTLAVLGLGCLLGLGGSWLAVGRHLRDIEPT